MRLDNFRRSSNVSDRRGMGAKSVGGVGGIFALALIVYLMGGNPASLIMEGVNRTIQSSASRPSKLSPQQQAEQADFAAAVLGSTEDVWSQYVANGTYPPAQMVLFAGATDTACGTGQSAMGPFYCPNDQSVYLDLDFFEELDAKLGAPGDFARAYVIAHEVGHHIQNLQGNLAKRKDNASSVKTELQADCYAGIWAHHVAEFGALEDGDLQEAIRAAGQVGDDKMQEKAQGYAVPDSFTHGTAQQRMQWFKTGFDSGEPAKCDTFGNK